MSEITLDVTSNVKGFLRGVEDAEQALEQVAGSLDDVARDGDKSTEKLERSFRELADASKRESKKIGDNFADNSRRGFSKAGDAARNFRDESKQNFAEMASSFDGSMQSIADAIQGTLGGASVAVGGLAGIALGALGVVGGAVLQQVMANAEESEARVDAMYQAFIESGLTYLTNQQRIDMASAITGDPAKLAAATQQAKDLGVTVQDVILAQVSAGAERNRVQQRLNELLAEQNAALEAGTYTDGTRLTILESYAAEYQKLTTEQNKAAIAADLQLSIAGQITGETKQSNEEIQRRNQLLANTPREVPTSLVVDDTELDRKLAKSRTVRVQLEGYSRTGDRIV